MKYVTVYTYLGRPRQLREQWFRSDLCGIIHKLYYLLRAFFLLAFYLLAFFHAECHLVHNQKIMTKLFNLWPSKLNSTRGKEQTDESFNNWAIQTRNPIGNSQQLRISNKGRMIFHNSTSPGVEIRFQCIWRRVLCSSQERGKVKEGIFMVQLRVYSKMASGQKGLEFNAWKASIYLRSDNTPTWLNCTLKFNF